MSFIQVDEMDFDEVLNEEFDKGQIVILKFGSEYCDACMALEFELEEVDNAHENVSILEIDCGDSKELAESYDIAQVPTMIIYENKNSILWHKKGILLAQDIEKIIKIN